MPGGSPGFTYPQIQPQQFYYPPPRTPVPAPVQQRPAPKVARGQMPEEQKPAAKKLVMPSPAALGVPTTSIRMPSPEQLGVGR